MTFESMVDFLRENGFQFKIHENQLMPQLIVDKQELTGLAVFFKNNEELFFDQLSCITGIDNGLEKNTIDVIYNFNSIIHDHTLCVKVELERTIDFLPKIPTVSNIWKTADWHEREAYDLVGIEFENHHDLRRILLPADWIGFPLRKDYIEEESYHNLKIKSN